MKKIKQLLMLIAIILPFLFAPAGVFADTKISSSTTSQAASQQSSVAAIKKRGKIVIGTAADYPPYEFSVKENGVSKRVGIDIDLGKQLAKDLGVKAEFKVMNFDSLLVALETHKVDVVIAAMSPTPERAKSVDFSKVYYGDNQDIVINKAEESKYKNLKDFDGKVIGAQNGSEQYDLAKQQMKGAKLKGLDRVNNLIIALQSHKVDGVVMDSTRAKAFVANNDKLKAINPHFKVSGQQGTAVAVAKDSPGLVAATNKTITKLQKHDTFDKVYVPRAGKYMSQGTKQNTVLNYWNYFVRGIVYTLIITVFSVFFGFILGFIFAMFRRSKNKVLHSLAVAYIEFIRGTPMMVQVMFVYFGIGEIIQNIPALVAGIIAVSINSGAYVAEIIRSGIQAINHGQFEASRSLGMSQKLTMRYVIMPQALRNIWPALGNEFITLLKDSSIVSVIGVSELMYQTQLVQSATYKGAFPLFIAMMIYFILTFSLTRLLNYGERKLNRPGRG